MGKIQETRTKAEKTYEESKSCSNHILPHTKKFCQHEKSLIFNQDVIQKKVDPEESSATAHPSLLSDIFEQKTYSLKKF